MSAAPRTLHHIVKGPGGTFSAKTKNSPSRIGITGCEDSLGVYFRIDSKHVFCAHMCVDSGVEAGYTVLSKEQGEKLTEMVCDRLIAAAKSEKCIINDVNLVPEMVVTCRKPAQNMNAG